MGVGLILVAFSGIGLLRPVENASYVILSPVESALRSIAEPIADTVANYGDVHDLTRENEALRTANERLQAEVARLREEGIQGEQLEELLSVTGSIPEQQFELARIYARSSSNLREMVAINLGTADGIRTGMPVVAEGETLVGTVTSVASDHAWVTLVTDANSAVSSLILESRAQGVVTGGYDRTLTMEFVDQDAVLNEGDTVLTSGLGGTYPPDLVVGRVTGVSGNPQELFRQVEVKPLASLAQLENVLVMVSFVPTRLVAP